MHLWQINNPDLDIYLLRARRARAEAMAASARLVSAAAVHLARQGLTSAARLVRAGRRRLVRWHRRHAMIQELMALDDHTLKDIGVNRAAIHGLVNDLLDAKPVRPVRLATTDRARMTSTVAPQPANDNATRRAA